MSDNSFSTCIGRLKWGIFPVRREVEETAELTFEVSDTEDSDKEEKEEEVSYEYRDEANRSWWSFFDEWEYRKPKNTIPGRKAVKWYHWFDPNDSPAAVLSVVRQSTKGTEFRSSDCHPKPQDRTMQTPSRGRSMDDT